MEDQLGRDESFSEIISSLSVVGQGILKNVMNIPNSICIINKISKINIIVLYLNKNSLVNIR